MSDATRPGTVGHPLYFLHLAKTGGSSLARLLDDAFPVGSRLPAGFVDEFIAASSQERERARLICGHLGRLPFDTLRARPVAITLLRDPAARAWSHYRALRFAHPGTSPSWRRRGVTFSDFLDDPVYGSTAADFQARWLACSPERDLRGPELPGLALAEPFGPWDPAMDAVTRQRRAAATLDQCALVGTTERLPELVEALGRLLGRSLPPPRALNVSAGPAEPPADAAARVRALSPVDVVLHDRANERLDRSLATLPAVPSITQQPIADLPHEHTMADALVGAGWHERVHTAAAGWHRWTGPSTRSTIHVPARLAGRARVLVTVVAACDGDVLDGVEVLVQDRVVGVSRFDRRRGVDVVGDVELDPGRPVVVELRVPRTKRLPGASAGETAGIAVSGVRFEPSGTSSHASARCSPSPAQQ